MAWPVKCLRTYTTMELRNPAKELTDDCNVSDVSEGPERRLHWRWVTSRCLPLANTMERSHRRAWRIGKLPSRYGVGWVFQGVRGDGGGKCQKQQTGARKQIAISHMHITQVRHGKLLCRTCNKPMCEIAICHLAPLMVKKTVRYGARWQFAFSHICFVRVRHCNLHSRTCVLCMCEIAICFLAPFRCC